MRTRKLVLLMLLLTLVGAFAFTVPARADKEDWDDNDEVGLNLDVSCPHGKLVIDVKHKVVNDGDSGIPRYWAHDKYKKHIRVWQGATPTTFCAVVQYEGTFVSTAGASPGDTGTIAAGITGSMTGGYRATITGTLNPVPAYHRHGNLGTFDYGWTGADDGSGITPFPWVSTYFSGGYVFDYVWWGWVYNAGKHGIWFNTAGNAGDIHN